MQVKSPKQPFSFATFPDSKHFQQFLILLIAGGVLILLPSILPDFGRDLVLKKVVNRVNEFQLTDSLQNGVFRTTSHPGNPHASLLATFQGYSILKSPVVSPFVSNSNSVQLKEFVQTLEQHDFNRKMDEIYYGIVLLKQLGLLENAKTIERFYNLVHELAEPNSAFRLDSEHTSSVRATYFAFKAIEELGKMQPFRTSEQYKSAIAFVTAMRGNLTENPISGFSDTQGVNATIEATFYAVQLLPTPEAFSGVEKFVYQCQAQDGGFTNEVLQTVGDAYYTPSSLQSTAQALYILHTLHNYNYNYNYNYNSDRAVTANTFLRSQIHHPSSLHLKDLLAFVQLIEGYENVRYGTPASLEYGVVFAGFTLIVAALFSFYKPQIPEEAVSGSEKIGRNVLLFLALGTVSVSIVTSLAVPVYLSFAFYLAVVYYEAQSTDTTEGIMLLVGCISSLAFLGLIVAMHQLNPFGTAHTAFFYYALFGWEMVSIEVVTVVASFFIVPKQRISFYTRAAVLTWIANLVFLYSLLYARGDVGDVYRMIVGRGTYLVVFIGFPFVSFIGALFAAAVGYLVFCSPPASIKK